MCGSAAAHLLGLQVQISPGAWMSVSCEGYVLSDRSLCIGPINLPSREILPCVVCWTECDCEALINRRLWTRRGYHMKEGGGGVLTVGPEIMWTQYKVFNKLVTTLNDKCIGYEQSGNLLCIVISVRKKHGLKKKVYVYFHFFKAYLQNCEKWALALSCLSVHPPICIEQHLSFHSTDFHEIWYLSIFLNSRKFRFH